MKKIIAIKMITTTALAVCICTSMLCACGSQNAAAPTVSSQETQPSENTKSAEETVDNILEQNRFKGIALIVKDGTVVYDKGFGSTAKEDGTEITDDTVFRIASNTKQFTAAAVMLLQQEGKLSVNDTIGGYFSDYPYAKDITIHELLCMRSGIKDYIAYTDDNGNHLALRESEIGYEISATASPEQNRAAVKAWLFGQELNFAPNEKFEYSNSNYLLLAEIIEQTSGMTYEDYVNTHIFAPLGMTRSGFIDSCSEESDVIAQPMQSDPATEYMTYPGMSFGAGNMLSTAQDIAKWAASFADGGILSGESVKAMTTDYSQEGDAMRYGYGLMIADDGIYHTGYLPSFSSAFYALPDREYNVILMSNDPRGNIETVMNRINRELGEILKK